MLTQLEIKNFRGFSALDLKGLQRVNLVVGRNNCGKTSLLEAIALVAHRETFSRLPGLLRSTSGNADERYYKWLLKDAETPVPAIVSVKGVTRSRTIRLVPPGAESVPGEQTFVHGRDFVYCGQQSEVDANCSVVSVEHRSPEELVKLFAAAVKRKGGEEMIEALVRKVDDRIRKIRVAPFDDGNHIMVDIGLSQMLPLSQVGQGINRILAVFSELVGQKPAVCLIDEIENGIHHSMLEEIWNGLAVAAESLDIQVFVTTHSHECIEAAHRAFSKRGKYDLSVIQLFRIEAGIQGRVVDRDHIEAALAGDIDLRS
jgi:predicted ATPase